MEPFSWVSHPAKERPIVAIAVTVFSLVIFYVVHIIAANEIMVIVAIAIFFLSLSTFYFPTKYTVDDKQVSIKYLLNYNSKNMSAFRIMYPAYRGVLLSPFLTPSRAENFRGFYLRYGKNNKAEVDQYLAKIIDAQRVEFEKKLAEEKANGA